MSTNTIVTEDNYIMILDAMMNALGETNGVYLTANQYTQIARGFANNSIALQDFMNLIEFWQS